MFQPVEQSGVEMTTIDAIRREYERYPPRGIRRMTRWFKKRLPTRLYARTLLIIIIYIRVIPLPAWVLLAYWFFLQVVGGSVASGGSGGGVAFWAHIGGFVAGVALVKLFEKRKLVTAKRAGHVLSRDEMGRWDPW